MFVRYGKAAFMAAIMALTANAVRAQETCPRGGCSGGYGYAAPACCQKTSCCEKKSDCAAGSCCKEGKCCKEAEPCCKDMHVSTCCKEVKCPCCPFADKLAKHTAIIMVMPASMPLLGQCPLEAMGIMPHPMPHPMLPPGAHVMIPPPLPPPVPMPYSLNAAQANTDVCYGYRVAPAGSPIGLTCTTCAAPAPTAPAKVCMTAKPSNDQLEMSIGDNTSIRSKKMTVTIGDKEITLSIFDGRVRVRGEDLKATADSVRSDGKDRIILVGDVELHKKDKESHFASVFRAGKVVLNLSNGTVTATAINNISTVPTGCVPGSAPYSR